MAGHSKWANIKHRKGAADARRAKVFTKLIRELVSAARMGGGDADANPRLRLAIQKARSANMPKDTVDKAVKRGSGGGNEDNFEEGIYEGYGANGAGFMVEVLTDNKVRTAADVRRWFTKFGNGLGSPGSVGYNFDRVGQILVSRELMAEDALMEHVLESGAEDLLTDDEEQFEVLCAPENFNDVRDYFETNSIEVVESGVIMRPKTRVQVSGDDLVKMLKLVNALEDNDDVQNVYHNFDADENELQEAMERV